MKLIDSHCHLDYFSAEDRTIVLSSARQAGVIGMVSISTKPSNFQDLWTICKSEPDVWCSAGLHPVHVGDEQFDRDVVLEQAALPGVVAIGESGLDYYRSSGDSALQCDVFRAHIEIAQELDKVLVVHARDADDDIAKILGERFAKKPFKAILHCFSGSQKLLALGLECGFYISYSGIVTFRKSADLRRTVGSVPSTSILVETDSPYLAPEPYRGRRNQPAYVNYTLESVANEYGCSVQEMASLTCANFLAAYGIRSFQSND